MKRWWLRYREPLLVGFITGMIVMLVVRHSAYDRGVRDTETKMKATAVADSTRIWNKALEPKPETNNHHLIGQVMVTDDGCIVLVQGATSAMAYVSDPCGGRERSIAVKYLHPDTTGRR